jgi:acetyl esterase/lipase
VQLEKVLPSVITLIGDSAGAHLLLSLILHIANQNPLVSPLELEGKFAGAVLLSPWVAMASIAESMQSNQEKDILSAGALEYWAQNFMGDAAPDPWNTPLIAPDEWWSQIPVHDIAVIYGDDELLRDDTARLCEKLQVLRIPFFIYIDSRLTQQQGKHPRVTVLKFVNEIHVNMVMNHFLRIKSKCESKRAFIEWMENHLQIGKGVQK